MYLLHPHLQLEDSTSRRLSVPLRARASLLARPAMVLLKDLDGRHVLAQLHELCDLDVVDVAEQGALALRLADG